LDVGGTNLKILATVKSARRIVTPALKDIALECAPYSPRRRRLRGATLWACDRRRFPDDIASLTAPTSVGDWTAHDESD
jgi:hypothetical protein